MRIITDPVEQVVAFALEEAGIEYVHESERRIVMPPLDFHLTKFDVAIECKQFASDRSAEQLAQVRNVILIQGMDAARAFAAMINRRPG